MPTQEWSQIWHNGQLDVSHLQAAYVHHAYPRHSHDYYVICLIERGRQTFVANLIRWWCSAGLNGGGWNEKRALGEPVVQDGRGDV